MSVQITDRDIELVKLMDRWGGLTAGQIGVAIGLAPRVAQRRLAALGKWDLARSYRPAKGLPALWVPTKEGLREATGDDRREAPSVTWGSYRHQAELGRVLAELHRADVWYLSERQIRRDQASEGHQDYSLLLGTSANTSHQPDALWFPSVAHGRKHQAVAIEIERSRKGGTRLRRILEAYERSPHFLHVLYVCNHATHTSTQNVIDGKPWRRGEAPRTSLHATATAVSVDAIEDEIPQEIQRFAGLPEPV